MVKKDNKPNKITPEMLGQMSSIPQGFDNMFDGQNEDPNKHLKELLSSDGDIDAKTDLSVKHIRALIKLRYLALILGKQVKDDKENVIKTIPDKTILGICEDFKRLRISKDRKSRKEFGDAIQGSNSMNRQEGMFNRLGKWFGGG